MARKSSRKAPSRGARARTGGVKRSAARRPAARKSAGGMRRSKPKPQQLRLVIETREVSPISRPDLIGTMPKVEKPLRKGKF